MNKNIFHTVNVLSPEGNLLAKCTPKRARKLIKGKRARPVKYGGSFAIQLKTNKCNNRT